jgi:hypothetical protein
MTNENRKELEAILWHSDSARRALDTPNPNKLVEESTIQSLKASVRRLEKDLEKSKVFGTRCKRRVKRTDEIICRW